MLAHSPPLPLTINYWDHEMTREDEEGILLALRHSDCVHYIGLYYLPTPVLWKIITTMDEQFPILERFFIKSQTEGDTSFVTTFLPFVPRAPITDYLPLHIPVSLTTSPSLPLSHFSSSSLADVVPFTLISDSDSLCLPSYLPISDVLYDTQTRCGRPFPGLSCI